jgi:hypothetical protein
MIRSVDIPDKNSQFFLIYLSELVRFIIKRGNPWESDQKVQSS